MNIVRCWIAMGMVLVGSQCTRTPDPDLLVPSVIGVRESPDYTSVRLQADFDHTDNIREAGFFLYLPDGTNRLPGVFEGHALTARYDGLEPGNDYRYSVWFSNGRDEEESETFSFSTPELPFDPGLWKHLLTGSDADGDGTLSDQELAAVRELVLSDLPLQSLAGLERLPNLTTLYMGANGLRSIDLSANKQLVSFSGGRDPVLEEIRFDNPELLQIYLLANNRIRTLDLSRLPKLYICEWWGVPLEEIDFSHNPDLYTLRFSETRLQEVDLSANRKLSHLESKQNPLLKTIWLKEGMVLETCDIESHTQIRFK